MPGTKFCKGGGGDCIFQGIKYDILFFFKKKADQIWLNIGIL